MYRFRTDHDTLEWHGADSRCRPVCQSVLCMLLSTCTPALGGHLECNTVPTLDLVRYEPQQLFCPQFRPVVARFRCKTRLQRSPYPLFVKSNAQVTQVSGKPQCLWYIL